MNDTVEERRNGASIPLCDVARRPSFAMQLAAVIGGALLLAWPAILNRFPLLYPDSKTYIRSGSVVARAVFLHRLSDNYGTRSFFYSLGILPFHWNTSLWPVVALQTLLTSFVIWLVVRSLSPSATIPRFLATMAFLSAFTSLGWFACFIMPDILDPLLYLSIYLMVFASGSLSRPERWATVLVAWWGITSHASHFLLAAGLCVLLAIALAIWGRTMRDRLTRVGEVTVILVVAATSQLALHGYLYGHPSLNGEHVPFLMARVISDGPGRWYLQQHCGERRFVVCRHAENLPDEDADGFLWDAKGGYASASDEDRRGMRNEESAFVFAAVRAYPRAQLSKSAVNVWKQLTTFDLEVFDDNEAIRNGFQESIPGARAGYLRSRQSDDDLPLETFSSIQLWATMISLAVVLASLPWLWSHRDSPLAGLAMVVLVAIVANAAITGSISNVENRYETRVIWLLPLLAWLLVWNQPQSSDRPVRSPRPAPDFDLGGGTVASSISVRDPFPVYSPGRGSSWYGGSAATAAHSVSEGTSSKREEDRHGLCEDQ